MGNKDLIIHSNLTLKQKVAALLVCTAQEQTAKMIRTIKHLGISLLQVQILHALSCAEQGCLTVNQIKDLMVDESPNVSRSLNKLMENGYITKRRTLEDQRVVLITISDAGRQAHIDADKELVKVSLDLSENDHKTLYAILSKI